MSELTMYPSTSATTSPSTSTRTSAPLIYTITFKPNSAGSPDLVTYRGISNINITEEKLESPVLLTLLVSAYFFSQCIGGGTSQARNNFG